MLRWKFATTYNKAELRSACTLQDQNEVMGGINPQWLNPNPVPWKYFRSLTGCPGHNGESWSTEMIDDHHDCGALSKLIPFDAKTGILHV